MKFYPSEKDLLTAYQKGEVETINAVTPQELEKIKTSNDIKSLYLPRIFSLFFNQKQRQSPNQERNPPSHELIR